MSARSDVARMMTNGLGVMSNAEEATLLDAFAAEVLTEAANGITAACFTHNPGAATGWITCHCEVADDLRKQAALPTA